MINSTRQVLVLGWCVVGASYDHCVVGASYYHCVACSACVP
jgi:hypothetical protein